MAGIRIEGNTSGNVAEVTNTNRLEVNLGNDPASPSDIGGVSAYGMNDDATLLPAGAIAQLLSPETDLDFRQRSALDTLLDIEVFNYTAQNTGKHSYRNTTMTNAWNIGSLTTNSGNSIATTTGTLFSTYAYFPVLSTSTASVDAELSFSVLPVSNTTIDFGLFIPNTSNPYNPTDGVYIRLTAAGFQGVVNYNGNETASAVSPFTITPNQKYQFIIYATERYCEFWVNNGMGVNNTNLIAIIPTPVGNGRPFASGSLPFSIRHAIVGGAASGIMNANLASYSVRLGGPNIAEQLGNIGNKTFGSYQGLSGGTMGQLVAGTVTSGTLVKPTAAIPANTSLVANLPNSLGGRIYETLSSGLAANVDGIFASYTVPAGTASVRGARLKVTGIKLSGMVSTVVVGGPAFTEWYIAFGHTADSLATAEGAAAKAPRRIMLPELTTNMGAAAAAGTLLAQPAYSVTFDQPIYVNPGERIALVGNKTISTTITSGILSFVYQFVYSWE